MDKRTVGIVVVIVVAFGLGIHFYQQSVESKDQAGKAALYQIQKTFEIENTALPEADRAAGVALDVDAKFPKTVASLNQMLSAKAVPAVVLFEAGFKLGTLYLDHGQTEKAVSVLAQLPTVAKTDFQQASGFYLLGSALERANKAKEAIDSFEKGLAKGIEGLKGEFMVSIVRASLKMQDAGKAKLYVEKLGKELPGTASAKAAAEMMK